MSPAPTPLASTAGGAGARRASPPPPAGLKCQVWRVRDVRASARQVTVVSVGGAASLALAAAGVANKDSISGTQSNTSKVRRNKASWGPPSRERSWGVGRGASGDSAASGQPRFSPRGECGLWAPTRGWADPVRVSGSLSPFGLYWGIWREALHLFAASEGDDSAPGGTRGLRTP